MHSHAVLNFVWVGAKRKLEAASKDEPLPLVFTAGGSRRGKASDNWRLECVRQVIGLVPNIGASGGKQIQGRPQALSWMHTETYPLHDELFHETLRPMEGSTFA